MSVGSRIAAGADVVKRSKFTSHIISKIIIWRACCDNWVMMHFVLLSVVVAVATSLDDAASPCSSMCICLDADYEEGIIRCTKYSPNISHQLNTTRDHLTLTDFDGIELNELVSELMMANAENHLEFLTQLTIRNSIITETLTFGAFNRLKYLTLNSNRIANLMYTLNNNNISLNQSSLRTFESLQVLNLSANCLNNISSTSFASLIALKCLDLADNNLTKLNSNVFAPLAQLQYLNLSRNFLTVLNDKCFSNLLKLQHLDVSGNRLNRIELGSLQLPSLARLLLAGNAQLGISHEPPFIVGTGQRLQTVDASGIGLAQIPSALTRSIRTLKLADNFIRIIRCGDLDSYPLLQLLDFNGNGLASIEEDALGRLDSLTILYLTNNVMQTIPKSLSEKLKVLHLERNRIARIASKDLQGLRALQVLLLNDNSIQVIEEEAFSQLESLVTLDISRNPIKVLQAGSLSSSAGLQVLRMSGIKAAIAQQDIVSFPLFTTEQLITLDLSGSAGLARQLLVDTAALASSRQLQELDLSATNLEFIRSDLLHFLPQLRILRIAANRINCTQLQWLAEWMRRQDDEEYKKITCASPAEMWGMALVDLQEAESVSTAATTTEEVATFDQIVLPKSTPNFFTQTTVDTTSRHLPAVSPTQLIHANQLEDDNKPPRETAQIRRNLFIAKTAPQPPKQQLVPQAPSLIAHTNSNSSHEHHHASHGQTSMFSSNKHHQGSRQQGILHPGMLILAAGILGAAAALTLLAVRISRQRNAMIRMQNDIEVNNLPGVTELW